LLSNSQAENIAPQINQNQGDIVGRDKISNSNQGDVIGGDKIDN